MKLSYLSLLTATLLAVPALASNINVGQQFDLDPAKAPAQNFDLSKWKINLPELTTEGSRKGKTLEIGKKELSNVDTPYVHLNGSTRMLNLVRWCLWLRIRHQRHQIVRIRVVS